MPLRPAICATLLGAALLFTASPLLHAGSATWNLNPADGDWNTAANWTPATVPNDASDTATFGVSHTKTLFFTASPVEVATIVFQPGASAFQLTLDTSIAASHLIVSGTGFINNSGTAQNVTLGASEENKLAILDLTNGASAGDGTVFTVMGSQQAASYGATVNLYDSASAGSATFKVGGALVGHGTDGGQISFYDLSSAGSANVTLNGGQAATGSGYGAQTDFHQTSNAGNATFVLNPGHRRTDTGGFVSFHDGTSAGNATFTLNGPTSSGGEPQVIFNNTSSAANSMFVSNGGATPGYGGGNIYFIGSTLPHQIPSAGAATVINNGGTVARAGGAETYFEDDSTASASRLVANAGTHGAAGGGIYFYFSCDGGEAQVEVYGNGYFDVSHHNSPGVTTGSLGGDGVVYLGSRNLTVGSNDLDTTFSGLMQDAGGSGSLTKIGSGTFTLTGANTYTGGTMVESGTLALNNPTGSATGSGPVTLNAGTLSGSGTIAGTGTIGTGSGPGALLAPSAGGTAPATLTFQSLLTFAADATCQCTIATKRAQADSVSAVGVTIASGAQFKLTSMKKKRLEVGQSFVVIDNTSASPISGTFANLPDGSVLKSGNNRFQADYKGGDGNDLTLTAVP